MFVPLNLRRVGAAALAIAVVAVILLVFAAGKESNAQDDSVCTDSDGGQEYFAKGTIDAPDFNGNLHHNEDVCLISLSNQKESDSGAALKEYWCDRNHWAYSIYNCPSGCEDGACVEAPMEESATEECADSDGGRDYLVKGETTDFGDTREDKCFDAKTLTEFYCEQAAGQTRPSRGAEQKKCEYGCEDGACREAPSEDELARIERLKGIIANISGINGMIKGMSVIEGAFRQIAKDGVATPEDLKQTIAKAKEIRPEIMKFRNKKAEKLTNEQAEALTGYASEMCGVGVTFEEWGGRLPQYLLLGARMKRISKDLKQARIDVGRAVKIALSSKYKLSDKAEELNEAIDALQTISNDFITTDDFDEKDKKIDEFYDQFQNIYDMIWTVNALQSIGQTVDTTQFKNFKIFDDFCRPID